MDEISIKQARQITLHAAGFGHGFTADQSGMDALIRKIGLLQIDSVNVFQRSHYMPVYSRVGKYSQSDLDALTLATQPKFIEYWAHQASFIPLEDRHLFHPRMTWYRDRFHKKPAAERKPIQQLMDWIVKELEANGPMRINEFEHDLNKRKSTSWWGWSDLKVAAERLFFMGTLTSAGRHNFQRRYALAEQVVPVEHLQSRLSDEDAQDELVLKSLRHLGLATVDQIADFYRFYPTEIRDNIRRLQDAGKIIQVSVENQPKPVYIIPGTTEPAPFSVNAILTPFDQVVWHRERAKWLYDFDYKIEIYVPEPKRIYGYYSLPIMLENELVGRVDLKHERKEGTLLVKSVWQENPEHKYQIGPIAVLLRDAAEWVGAEKISVESKGNAAASLKKALK
ncbi:MAG: YcaQ family DNA glycosylase [Microbacteriaceae bacterium]|nr:YcaQ family DNA glycosylase [Microbacteriaceae bacterium]